MKIIKGFENEDIIVSDFGEWVGKNYIDYKSEYKNNQKIIKSLLEENKQLKEAIDKIDNYINNYDVFKVFSFPLMKRWEEQQVKSSIDYEFKTSLIKDLKDILKEVSE